MVARAGLKILWSNPCGFESHHPYQPMENKMGKTYRKVSARQKWWIKKAIEEGFWDPRRLQMELKGVKTYSHEQSGSVTIDGQGNSKLNKFDDVSSKQRHVNKQRRCADKLLVANEMESYYEENEEPDSSGELED